MDKKLRKYIKDNKEFVDKITLNLWAKYSLQGLGIIKYFHLVTEDNRRVSKAHEVLCAKGYIEDNYIGSEIVVKESAIKHAKKLGEHKPFHIGLKNSYRSKGENLYDYYHTLEYLNEMEIIYIFFHQNEFDIKSVNGSTVCLPLNQLNEARITYLSDLAKGHFDSKEILNIAYGLNLKVIYKDRDYMGDHSINDYSPDRVYSRDLEDMQTIIKDGKKEIKNSFRYYKACDKEMRLLDRAVNEKGTDVWKLFLKNFLKMAPLYISDEDFKLKKMAELSFLISI